jgi:succinate dehydrogenase/fumarate reductase-like Fe-S protein
VSQTPHVANFEIEFVAGQSVLDGLPIIRRDLDPRVSLRSHQRRCMQECMMQIDGKIDYACATRRHEGTKNIAPLPKTAPVRDLVTEIAPPDERLCP